MTIPTTVPVARLRELLHYDPTTGIFTWRIAQGNRRVGSVAGTLNRRGYRRINIDGVSVSAHRAAWAYMTGEWPTLHIDHERGGGDNNIWTNLREATRSQNQANAKLSRCNKIGLKGVTKTASGRYAGHIWTAGSSVHLGTYDTPEEAHAAYLSRAIALRGAEFVRAA